MASKCKAIVTPVHYQWRYNSLHRAIDLGLISWNPQHNKTAAVLSSSLDSLIRTLTDYVIMVEKLTREVSIIMNTKYNYRSKISGKIYKNASVWDTEA